METNKVEDVFVLTDLELAARFDEIDDAAALPDEVKNFIPPPDAIIWKCDGERSIRLIFGDLPLDRFEQTQLNNLIKELRKVHFPLNGTCFESRDYLLRYLQGNEWDIPSCIEDMRRHLEWAKVTFPLPLNGIDRSLMKGYCYISGRDRYLRPVVIIRCDALQDSDVNEALNIVIYWLEYTKQKMLVKNRVDQWSVIVDLGSCALTRFPVSTMKEVALCLSRNFRGRLCQMLIINSPMIAVGLWKIVSLVLPASTRKKICLLSSNFQSSLLSCIHPNQLEEHFGGNQPNAKRFDRPILPPPPFF